MRKFRALLTFIGMFAPLPVLATGQPVSPQSHAVIHETIATFVQAQVKTLPGKITVKVDDIDQRIVRPACSGLEAFLPPGSRLLGNSMVGVRCPGKGGWTLFVPVHVRASVDMLISNRPLSQGRVLLAEDISTQNGEMTQMSTLLDPARAIGKVLKYSIGAGQLLRQDMLREPYAVTQGQTVQLQVEGAGFSIRADGSALNNAAEGQAVKVKTASGQVVTGTALPNGVVNVRP